MKNRVTFGIAMFSLFALSVEAQTQHCHSTEECINLRKEVEADLNKNFKMEITEVLKTNVNHYEAELVCLKQGMRLPTARELAHFSRIFGGRGIKEPAPELRGLDVRTYAVQREVSIMKSEKYYPYYKHNEDSIIVVDFYYSTLGMKRFISTEFDDQDLWTSSPYPQNKDEYYIYSDGSMMPANAIIKYRRTAVRCMP